MKYLLSTILIFTVILGDAYCQKKMIILEKAFNSKEAIDYFHPVIENRNPYYLLENKFINRNDSLQIQGVPVIPTAFKNINGENYIKIYELTIKKCRAIVNYYYKIENANITILLEKKNGDWKVVNTRITET